VAAIYGILGDADPSELQAMGGSRIEAMKARIGALVRSFTSVNAASPAADRRSYPIFRSRSMPWWKISSSSRRS
jgi:hypothetical protein